MPKLITQAGAITVVIRDDRAEMDKKTLKAWKAATLEIVEGVAAHLIPEEEPDGE